MFLAQGCTNPGRLALPSDLILHIYCSFPLTKYILVHLNRAENATKTLNLTGHCRTLAPQYGISFMSPFWCLELGGGPKVFGNFLGASILADFFHRSSNTGLISCAKGDNPGQKPRVERNEQSC